jgi:acyl-CoA reductase-like NAD-dependent aldehyde dehydrogenase
VINVLHGDADVGSALISHPAVRKISFTGGPETAKSIMRSAAESLTRIHFELGGNDPAIVLDDADLEFAVDKIAGYAFRRAGQVCYAVKRVYVPRRLAGDFNERLLARMGEIQVGHGLDPKASMGPLNNKLQFTKIAALHERLAAGGANVQIAGIKLNPDDWQDGYYFRPAAVLDADPADEIVTGEQFGPILPVVTYDTENEVVAMANGTEYGLGSSIWSSDEDRAVALAAKVEAGMTIINGHALSMLGRKEIPFGGTKQSGMGWENSTYGLLEYVEFHSTDVHKGAGRTPAEIRMGLPDATAVR